MLSCASVTFQLSKKVNYFAIENNLSYAISCS